MNGPAPTSQMVCCHRCAGSRPSFYESDGRFVNPSQHPRGESRMIGSSEWGTLWHCREHAADCPMCPRGDLTDRHPDDPPPYRETVRHTPHRAAGRP